MADEWNNERRYSRRFFFHRSTLCCVRLIHAKVELRGQRPSCGQHL